MSDGVKPPSFPEIALDEVVLSRWRRGERQIGPGVREVRIRDQAGAFRVIYTAARPEAVYVLHAFQKTTQATPKRDLALAKTRFRELAGSTP